MFNPLSPVDNSPSARMFGIFRPGAEVLFKTFVVGVATGLLDGGLQSHGYPTTGMLVFNAGLLVETLAGHRAFCATQDGAQVQRAAGRTPLTLFASMAGIFTGELLAKMKNPDPLPVKIVEIAVGSFPIVLGLGYVATRYHKGVQQPE